LGVNTSNSPEISGRLGANADDYIGLGRPHRAAGEAAMIGVRFVVLLLAELKIVCDVIENCEIWEAEKARDFEAERAERPHRVSATSRTILV